MLSTCNRSLLTREVLSQTYNNVRRSFHQNTTFNRKIGLLTISTTKSSLIQSIQSTFTKRNVASLGKTQGRLVILGNTFHM